FLSFVGPSSEKMGQFGIHHFAEVFPNHLPHIEPDHFEDLFRLGLNLFENGDNLGYTDFDFHWRFSFLGWFWSNPRLMEKRLFFYLFGLFEFTQKILHCPKTG